MDRVKMQEAEKLVKKVLMPYVGEFGSKLAKHCTGVHFHLSENPDEDVVVCHEVGEEPIYPLAKERWTYERPEEDYRGAEGHRYQDDVFEKVRKDYGTDVEYIDFLVPFKWSPKYFVPQERVQYDFGDIDILIFPRLKEYAHGRNYPHWDKLHPVLKAAGFKTFLAGQPDSCLHLDAPAVWDYADKEHILDATILAIKQAKMRLGTATGTTFLSVMCGKPPVVIISEQGFDARGGRNGFNSGSYYKLDHTKCGWRVIAHWHEPTEVVRECVAIMENRSRHEKDWSGAVTGITREEEKKRREKAKKRKR